MAWLEDDIPRWFTFFQNYDDLATKYIEVYEREVNQGNSFSVQTEISYARDLPNVYSETQRLTNIINAFDKFGEKIDSGGVFDKARLRLSEDKRFQFSFSLASKGLFRIPEYFSVDLAKEHPHAFNSTGKAETDPTMVAGVVDNNLVESIQLANETKFFIKYSGKEYVLRQQQKGTAYILNNDPLAKLIYDNSVMGYSSVESFGQVNLAFGSSTKKSYIEIPKEGGRGQAIDLYIPFDLMVGDVGQRLLSCVPLLFASEFFAKARIKVRINIVRTIGVMADRRKVSIFMSFTLKDFDESLNWDKIALLRGDYDRGKAMTTMNACLVAVDKDLSITEYDGTKRFNSSALYMAGTNDHLTYNSDVDTEKEFGRYKNWLYQQTELGVISRKLVPKPLMMILSTEGLLGDGRTIDNVTHAIQARLEDKFYEILDATDMFYNKNLSKVVSRIKKRFDEQGKSITQLKRYLQKLAGKLYRDAYPRQGEYASTPEELSEADTLYNQTLTKIGNITSNYQ